MKAKKNKTVFYLRTDLGARDLKAGGSVAHTLGVLGGLLDLNYTIECASSAMIDLLKNMPLEQFCALSQPKIFSFLGFRLNCLLSNLFFTIRSVRFLRKKKIDFIYQRYSLLNFVGLFLSWIKKVPLILEFNGSEVWIDKNWSNKGWMRIRFLIRWIENVNVKRADQIIVVSHVLKETLIKQGIDEKKILVNPNGVNTETFNPARLTKIRSDIRTYLGLENKFVFGFVGSFSVWHGIEVLAEMIPKVVKKHPAAHFLLVGAGPLLSYLKQELARSGVGFGVVTIPGSVNQSVARNYLSVCDAFLSPTVHKTDDGSRFFGSPTKMFEYMSMGRPIIASDLEQLADLLCPAVRLSDLQEETFKVIKKKVGILVPPGDVQGFVDAACALITMSPEDRALLGKNARQKAIAQYSWRDHTKRLLDVMKKSGQKEVS